MSMDKIGKNWTYGLPLLKILLFMYIVTGGLLLLLTVLLSKMQLSEGAVSIGIVAIYVISGFLGGLLAGKRMKSRKFLWGMVMGACYFLVLAIGSVVFHKGLDMEMTRFATTLVLCIASGMVGGMVG
ncbi:MAG: TIGR04086 family membrane protein [Lachnospiraceae bacterium]|jgi:putative membrane protein (TIGR04086 family)|nr:TIGR04086 family membrane protein [Lachnospiraceae bacterium]